MAQVTIQKYQDSIYKREQIVYVLNIVEHALGDVQSEGASFMIIDDLVEKWRMLNDQLVDLNNKLRWLDTQ